MKYLSFYFLVFLFSCFLVVGCSDGGPNYAQADNQSDGLGNVESPPPILDLMHVPSPTIGAVTATASLTQVSLSWQDTSPNENGFEIWRDAVKIGETGKNIAVWTDKQVTAGATYCYKIVAFNKEYVFVSEQKCATVPLPPPNVEGFGIYAEARLEGIIVGLFFNDPGTATGFEITRNGEVIAIIPADTKAYRDANITAGVRYSYQATAFNSGGKGSQTGSYSLQALVTLSSWPKIWLGWPSENALVGNLTRMLLHSDIRLENAEVFLNGAPTGAVSFQRVNEIDSIKYESFCPYYVDADLSKFPDGAYSLTVKGYEKDSPPIVIEIPVIINSALLQEKADEFLYDANSSVIRWPSLPIPVELDSLFSQLETELIFKALDFWTKFTNITFQVTVVDDPTAEVCAPGWSFDKFAKNVLRIQSYAPCAFFAVADTHTNISYPYVNKAIINMSDLGVNYHFGQTQHANFISVMTHEIGHALFYQLHTRNESVMDIDQMDQPKLILYPHMALGFKKLYEMQPGDPIPAPAP